LVRTMNVSAIINSRQSVRAFTDQPVPLATVRGIIELDADEMIMAGISLGYADNGDPGADIRQPRAPLDEYATFNGFEED
jgi:nitroreductase